MPETDLDVTLSVKKPFLSDALNFQTDIAPYPFIRLWAGVGAGKNHLIHNLINGCPKKGFPRFIVLLISSRKSTILETLNDENLDASRYFTNQGNIHDIMCNTSHSLQDYCYEFEPEDNWPRAIYQRSLVCTNAAIEKYLKYSYDPSNPETHLWNRFDMIVWDEAHSLIMDSTYQHSPYHVMRLFQEAYIRMTSSKTQIRCKHLILMTGTPEPLEQIDFPVDFHTLDMRETCHHVSPANIHFIDVNRASNQIREQLKNNERIVYFANHVSFPNALSEQYEIPREKIAVSFSDENRRSDLKKISEQEAEKYPDEIREYDFERMENVETYLFKNESIRSDILLFHTTSRNKEGINIKDKDIHLVYIDSHSITDIKQMVGRIRNGAEHVYIIIDSVDHKDDEQRYEQDFAKRFCRKNKLTGEDSCANIILKGHLSEKGLSLADAYLLKNEEIDDFVDLIKSKTKYAEYDYFKRECSYNLYREKGREFVFSEQNTFREAKKTPDLLIDLFQKEFPKTKIHAYSSPEDEGKAYIQKYLEEHPEDTHPFDEIVVLGNYLRKLLGAPKRSKNKNDNVRNPNYYFHPVGFHFKRLNNNSSLDSYNFCTLKPYQKETVETKVA